MINYDDDKEDNSNNKPINEEVKELSLQLEKLSTDYENNLKRLKELSKILRGE